MKKTILTIIFLLVSSMLIGQEKEKKNLFKLVYDDLLKYGTVYGAGDVRNSVEPPNDVYFVRTNPDGGLYDVPVVVNNTPEYEFDYRIGFGIRKLARFNYERKPRNYYDGTENQLAFTAPTSAIDGLEYQFHYEKERWRGENFKNHRYFVKHTGKYHIVKLESREVGKVNVNYQSAEVRARLPIGKKFSISAGAVYRTHERAYGYNPVEIWLNEVDQDGDAINPWYSLGFMYGYDDIYYTTTDQYGQETSDWYWVNPAGETVAYTDLQFRETVFTGLMNRFNREAWDLLDPFGEVAPIVGVDFYHYKSKFWLHAYANWILPYHKYVAGDEDFSYGNRNNWGLGGLRQNSEFEQWDDYSAGLSAGWKLSKHLGVYVEGEYSKLWDSEIFNSSIGINFTFK
tara:strand:+ start:1564 stop:2760 length:1197 start_codon:yes stop_codon:yes gene_type:complete